MTAYNVFGGTLNLAQSNLHLSLCDIFMPTCLHDEPSCCIVY